jgi:hypothetical protein
MNKEKTYEMTGLTSDEVSVCQEALNKLKDDNMMTEIEKSLYKRLQTAESFIAGYNAWDDYMQYLIKIDSTYNEPTTADEYNNLFIKNKSNSIREQVQEAYVGSLVGGDNFKEFGSVDADYLYEHDQINETVDGDK